ncbi:MAG: adenylate kinase family protein [Sulfolobaceae archaeon]
MIILVTGTPGVGKTQVAKMLSSQYSMVYLNVSEFVINNNLFLSYDEEYQSYIIDEEKTIRALEEYISHSDKSIIIESIYPSLITKADKVIVLRKNPFKLYSELKQKGWPEQKVAENVMAEILGVISQEAREKFNDKVCEIDVTNLNINKILEKINKYECDYNIDWLNLENIEEFMFSLDKIINGSEEINMSEK